MKVYAVIGKNFGDEGKGLAVDYFSSMAQNNDSSCVVVRHNGGAQSGHTVDLKDTRFVFHQLSSGSFRNAHTFWSATYMPDFYKLNDELKDFYAVSSCIPKIFTHNKCRCVIIDDVLVNMALESFRANNRHGSCGMGINEAVIRSQNQEFRLEAQDVFNLSCDQLYGRLLEIRENYLHKRLKELGLDFADMGEYGVLLQNNNVLRNVSEYMKRGAQNVTVADDDVCRSYENVIFENGQGLLLDENYLQYAPHLTSSCTGINNPTEFIAKNLNDICDVPEYVFVSRTYVTRHGAGPLPHENECGINKLCLSDKTNITNDWQGSLRFAPHGNPKSFVTEVSAEMKKVPFKCYCSLMLTHLNETNGCVCSTMGNIQAEKWCLDSDVSECFDKLYFSASPFSQDVVLHKELE